MYAQFSGHQQHDAQELLSVFLDGLHEDLNLVAVKPYTELPDSDDREDSILADIWWKNHLSRDNRYYCTSIHTCMHACIHLHIHILTHTYMYSYIRTYTRIYICSYMHLYTHTHTYIYIYI